MSRSASFMEEAHRRAQPGQQGDEYALGADAGLGRSRHSIEEMVRAVVGQEGGSWQLGPHQYDRSGEWDCIGDVRAKQLPRFQRAEHFVADRLNRQTLIGVAITG